MKPELRVEITARMVWPTPAENMTEAAMRDQANVKVAATAKKIERGVKLILTEMLNEAKP